MSPRYIHVIGIDPGGTTGWCRITVPRTSIFPGTSVFEDDAREIHEWDYGVFTGPEPKQAMEIARLVVETQSLDYGIGPAVVPEAWDQDEKFKSKDPEALSPCRIGAMLTLLHYQKRLGDATLTFQSRAMAMSTATDERLRAWRIYVEHKDIRAAVKHAITSVRRAAENWEFAKLLWPNGDR